MSPFRPCHGVRTFAAAVAVVGLLADAGAASAAEPGACPNSDAAPTAANREQIETATICLVNAERIDHGLQPLRLDPRLDQAALAHTLDMQSRGYLSHTSPNGVTVADRVRAVGYVADAGENLLKGAVTPAQAVNLWLDSPPHRANILQPAYHGIGVGQGGEYWTQTYGKAEPPGDSSPSEPSDVSGAGGQSSPEGRAVPESGLETRGHGSSPGASGSGFEAAGPFPAKLRIVRADVRRGRLNAFATASQRTNGDAVRVTFISRGRRFSFTERIQQSRLRLRKRLPQSQRAVSTGIMEIHYAGSENIRPTEVRLRAARRSPRLQLRLLSLDGGVLRAGGTISRRARGAVSLRLSSSDGDEWTARAPIANGTWRLRATLPPGLRGGGYLTTHFTGYRPVRIRGAQIATEVRSGQSSGGG